MRLSVDLNRCEQHGQCVLAAPEQFEFDEDDNLAWNSSPTEEQREAAQRAVDACPMMAITLEEETN